MNKYLLAITLILARGTVLAEEEESLLTPQQSQEELPPFKTAEIAEPNQWQNWIFIGSLLLTAAGAVWAVSVDNGNTSH